MVLRKEVTTIYCMNKYHFMCDDIERAKENRNIISRKLYITAYLHVEAWLRYNLINDLPYWMYSDGFVDDRAKKKLKNLTSEQRSEIARKGGIARMKKMTPKEHSEFSRKAVNKRWHTS